MYKQEMNKKLMNKQVMNNKVSMNKAAMNNNAGNSSEEAVIQAVTSVVERMYKDASRPTQKQDGGSCKMTLALAKALIEKVEQKAAQMGVRAVVAVSDASARPVAVHCMDDAYIASFDIAFIGALGVSGGTAQEDTRLAAYGRTIFEEVAACL